MFSGLFFQCYMHIDLFHKCLDLCATNSKVEITHNIVETFCVACVTSFTCAMTVCQSNRPEYWYTCFFELQRNERDMDCFRKITKSLKFVKRVFKDMMMVVHFNLDEAMHCFFEKEKEKQWVSSLKIMDNNVR